MLPNFYVIKPSLSNRVWWKVKGVFAAKLKQ
jgi:hypothetical protein